MNPQPDGQASDFSALALRLLDSANEVDRLEAQALVADYVRNNGTELS